MRPLGLRLSAVVLGSVALSGCDEPTDDEAAAPPAGRNWIVVAEGERPVEEQPAVAAAPRRKEEHHPPELGVVHVEPRDPRCTGAVRPGVINPLAVEPGATTATVTWFHPGDPTVTAYRVTSIVQRSATGEQPDLVWQDRKPGDGCHELTATVAGLQRGTPYVFSVDAVHAGRTATVARSVPVVTG